MIRTATPADLYQIVINENPDASAFKKSLSRKQLTAYKRSLKTFKQTLAIPQQSKENIAR